MKVSPVIRQITNSLDNVHMGMMFSKYGGEAAKAYTATERDDPDQAARQYKSYLSTLKSVSSPAKDVKSAVSKIVGGYNGS